MRPQLIEIGKIFQNKNPYFLVQKLIEENCNLISGIRFKSELDYLRENYFVTNIWIDRNVSIKDSTQLTKLDSDVQIDNNGNFDLLLKNIRKSSYPIFDFNLI